VFVKKTKDVAEEYAKGKGEENMTDNFISGLGEKASL
jgi:hypothetical protein